MRGIRSIKHAMFSETEEGETLALIKKLDPTWDLHEMLMSALRSSSVPTTCPARGGSALVDLFVHSYTLTGTNLVCLCAVLEEEVLRFVKVDDPKRQQALATHQK